jgi:tellurite resistance protein TerC
VEETLPETIATPTYWTYFFVFVSAILILDLAVFGRKGHVATPRQSALWTLVCISLAGLFSAWLFWQFGTKVGLEFVTGYLIEYALSVDNLFVFLVIFNFFAVPPQFQRRALFWGILGAVVLRGAFILAGTALVARFEWTLYLFGAFLVWTGIKLIGAGEEAISIETNPAVRLARRFLPVTSAYHGEKFFVRVDGKLLATPLFLVLVVIDVVDVVFAVDSIPAVFGVTHDPFLVFTSNMFAILGLRALYFLLADFMDRFHYLKYGLGLVLAFVGTKMLVAGWYHVPIGLSLGVIVLLLGGSVLASFFFPPKKPHLDSLPLEARPSDASEAKLQEPEK